MLIYLYHEILNSNNSEGHAYVFAITQILKTLLLSESGYNQIHTLVFYLYKFQKQ